VKRRTPPGRVPASTKPLRDSQLRRLKLHKEVGELRRHQQVTVPVLAAVVILVLAFVGGFLARGMLTP
jgi:hypothetical protein